MAGTGYVQVPPDSTGKQVDMVSATVGGVSVARQVFALANGADGQTIAEVVNASASTGAVGVVVRPTTATVALVAGTTVDVNGGVAISGTAQVAIATPIVINNISATTVVSGLLSVTGTVQVAIATPYILQGISTTVQVAIATPYTIQGISTTVQVAGNLTIGSFIDAGSYTAAQANVTIMGGVFGDAYTALTTSQGGAVKITSARAIHTNLRDAAGNEVTAFAVSGTAQVAIATPIVINNISATTIVAGAVSLAAGTANIGTLNDISRTVQVAVGTPFTINNISATTVVSGLLSVTGTVQVAIATPYTLQGISTTVQVAIATPYILQGISTTVSTVCNITAVSAGVAINTQARAPAVMSASRGPKCVTASTSANVTLIASPGAGANIYIKQIGVHNFSTTFTAMRVGTSASIQTIVVAAQSSGGGAVYNFDPPWMLSASEAALCSVKPNANYGVFNVQFYVI